MRRNEKVAKEIKELAALFLNRVTNKTALITVTSASASPDLKKGTVYITVLPSEKEQAALHFCQRQMGELREFLKEKMSIKTIPYLTIKIDQGEKNRQKIDELLRNG